MKPTLVICLFALFSSGLLPLFSEESTPTEPVLDVVPLASTSPPNALSFESSITWQGQSWPTNINGIEASPIFIRFGSYFHLFLAREISFRFGADFFTDEYVYKEALAKAFPTQIEAGFESGTLALVLGFSPQANFAYDFFITEKTRIGVDLGLATLFRIALYGLDGCTGIEKITSYLNGGGKFLYTNIGVHSWFALQDGIGFGPWLRAALPVYRLFDGEGLPFWDTLYASLGIAVQITL